MFTNIERQRDIFPFPVGENYYKNIRQHSPLGIPLSRHMKRKLGKQSYNLDWMAEGINALNELSGQPFGSPPKQVLNLAQEKCLQHFEFL